MDVVSGTLQDIYSVLDTAMDFTSRLFLDFQYPTGTMNLDDDTAKKLSRSLIEMNDALPELMQKTKKYSAPAMLISTLLLDLGMKGAIIYGQYKQKHIVNAQTELLKRAGAQNQFVAQSAPGADHGQDSGQIPALQKNVVALTRDQ